MFLLRTPRILSFFSDPQRLLDGLCSSGAVQRAKELQQVYLATVRQASQEAQEMKTGRRTEESRTLFHSSSDTQAPAPHRASPLSPSRPQSRSPPSQPTLASQSMSPSFSASPSPASSSSSSSLLFSSLPSASLWLEKAAPVCQRMYTRVDRAAQAAIASLFQKLRRTFGGEGGGNFGSVGTRKRHREDEKKSQLGEETEEGGEYICVAAMEELTAEFVRWLRTSAASREGSLLEEEEDSLHAEGERTTERTTFLLAEQSLLSFWTTRELPEDSSSSTLPFSLQCFLGYLLSRSSLSSSSSSSSSLSASSASASLRASLCTLPISSMWPAASASSDQRGEESEEESLSTARGPASQKGGVGAAWRRLFPGLLRKSREKRTQDTAALGFLKVVKFSFARHSEATVTETEKSEALCRHAARQLKASADRLRDKIAHLRKEALAAARAGDRKTAGHLLRFLKQVEGRRDEVEHLLLQLENCLGCQARVRSMNVVADTLAGNEQVLKLHKRSSAALLGVAPETLETAIEDTQDAQEKLQRVADAFRVFASPGVPPQTDDALKAELEDLERRALEEKTASLLSTLPAVPHALSPLSLSPRLASPRKASPFLPRVARLANRKLLCAPQAMRRAPRKTEESQDFLLALFPLASVNLKRRRPCLPVVAGAIWKARFASSFCFPSFLCDSAKSPSSCLALVLVVCLHSRRLASRARLDLFTGEIPFSPLSVHCTSKAAASRSPCPEVTFSDKRDFRDFAKSPLLSLSDS
ncbi:UNVERIFIED_CONTAM: SNF7 family protein [Hammondia hammondi]|eukprot:XP_008881890.1 SNF7 family protein [Hammondia hammondi]